MNQLQAMRVFRRTVELGSFSAVAKEDGLSNAVVSKYVNQLEATLGTRLINRTTRQMSLTEAGQLYYATCVSVLDELDEASRRIQDVVSTPRGRLRLNAPMSFGLLHLSPALPAFMKQYPEIEVDLALGDQHQDVVGEGFDLALRIRAALPDSTLVAREIATVRRVLCAAPEYLARHGTPRHPHELQAHNCLAYSLASDSDHWVFEGAGQRHAVEVKGAFRSNNSLAILDALLAGTGIALVPTFIAGDALRRGALLPLLPGYAADARTLYAVHPGMRASTQKTQLLVRFLAERFSPIPYWDQDIGGVGLGAGEQPAAKGKNETAEQHGDT